MYEAINHGKEVLEWGIKERVEIKGEMDKLDLRLKNVNSAILSTMERTGMATFRHPLGTITYKKAGETHSLDKVKLMEALLGSGLSADKVKEIMEAADKPGERKASVSFTPDRGGDDG